MNMIFFVVTYKPLLENGFQIEIYSNGTDKESDDEMPLSELQVKFKKPKGEL